MSQRGAVLVDRWRAAALLLAAVLIAPMGYLGPLGFAPLAAVPAAIVLPLVIGRRRSAWLLLPLGLLAAWALVSWLWSPAAPRWSEVRSYDELETAGVGIKLAAFVLVAASFGFAADALTTRAARRVLTVTAAGVALLAALALVESINGAMFYQAIRARLGEPYRPDLAFRNVGQSVFVLAALFWPVAIAWTRMHPRWSFASWAVGLAICVAGVVFGMQAPVAALLAGAVTFAAFRLLPHVAGLAGATVSAGIVMTAPWWMGAIPSGVGEPASWTARIGIWRFVAARISERPLLGWGLDASRTFPASVPLHPHSAPLQLWLELGVVGAVLGAAAWAMAFLACAKRARVDRTVGAAWGATTTTYFVIGALSFGAWQEWWLGVGVIAAGAALMLGRLESAGADATEDRGLQPLPYSV